MPPVSSKRYQSKVFNFFNQQSQRLGQKLDSTIRSVKVATKFSLEAILLPLYQVLQPDKLVGKILQTAPTNKQQQLKSYTPPAADTAIKTVLELVKNLPSAAVTESQTSQNLNPLSFLGKAWGKISNKLGFSQSSVNNLPPADTLQNHIPTIQGIAVKIDNRNLVLVGENNKIFDVLTIQQQGIISEKINIEVTKAEEPEAEVLPEIERLLNKLTHNHENIINTTPKNNNNIFQIKSYPGQILALLDQALSKIENKAIVPVEKNTSGIIKGLKNQLEIFVYGQEKVAAKGEITVNSEGLKKQQFNISEFIESAINYFFTGRRIPQINEIEADKFYELTTSKVNEFVNQFIDNSQIQTSENLGDTWLTWSDLYGEVEIEFHQQQATQTAIPKKENNSSYFSSENSKDTTTDTTTGTTQPKLKPDWIETTAIFVGYEKHPLEQILEWLDRVMVWLELIFMNMVYFCKGLLQG